MLIFQEDNVAVKFFIQRDLPDEVRDELTASILELGGRVEDKVPRLGYVLTSPGTAEAERLRMCWTSPERPGRFFVPHTFVEACKIAGMHLKQIFTENGAPMLIHIHSSICNPNARGALSDRIIHSGGDPNATPTNARVILADPNTDVFQSLVKANEGKPGVYIESYMWVKKCIENGAISYTPVVFKNPGGRRKGEERTQFSEQDDQLLCQWIAAKIPYKETGGRTGNRLYQQLCELADDNTYSWVRRHTWQSWRERYKKNSERLDTIISAIVAETKPTPGEKGQYGYVREKGPRKRRTKVKDEHKETEDALHAEMQHLEAPRPLTQFATLTPDAPPIAGPSQPRMVDGEAPRKEEMEDDEEWAVRVGNDPVPTWGKRPAADDLQDSSPTKRAKYHSQPLANPPHAMHFVDSALQDIAKENGFLFGEVKQYYDKCGEMLRTADRFKKMRAMLDNHFGDESWYGQ